MPFSGPARSGAHSAGPSARPGIRSRIGTRNPEETRAARNGRTSTSTWRRTPTCDGDVFVNATSGAGALAALQAVGAALDGKVVIDTSNPLDHSQGFPPTLFVSNTDSLAEQLQAALPQARLVKMFNTMANQVMTNPGGLPVESTIFVAGNDDEARQIAAGLAADLGWTDIFDLGDLTAARGLEMWMPLWIRLYDPARPSHVQPQARPLTARCAPPARRWVGFDCA